MLNSLKPIFIRKPRSEGDTLEAELRELAGYDPDALPEDGGKPVEQEIVKESEGRQSWNKGILFVYDDFSLKSLTLDDRGNFVFSGLNTPEGMFSKLVLMGGQYLDQNGSAIHQIYTDHIAYSFSRFDPRTKDAPDCQFGITPSRIRGYVMRAGYTLSKIRGLPKPNKEALDKLVVELRKDGEFPRQHNAETIHYWEGGVAFVQVHGWPKGTVFYQDDPDRLDLAGDSPVEIKSGCGLEKILGKLFGDSNPDRVREVINFYWPNPNIRLSRCSPSLTNDKRVVVFGVYGDGTGINADYNRDYECGPARGVRVDVGDFLKK